MPKKVKPIPEGYRTVTMGLSLAGAAKAIEFYKKAFGATESVCMKGPDGKIMHAELTIGDSRVMLGEAIPEWGCGPTLSSAYLYVEDCDKLFAQAVKAGAKVEQPVQDQFWGDRMGTVKDPWGNKWSIGTHKEDLSEAEIHKRGEEWMRQHQLAGAAN